MEKMMNTKTEGNTFTKKIGQTVYVVRYHFNEDAKETLQEKNKENFCEFITDYGFTVVKVNLVDGGLAPVGVLIAKKTNY